MTEIEGLELMAAHGANAIMCFSLYITCTFAFLAAVHYVGPNVTSLQSIGISALYCFAAGTSGLAQLLYQQIMLSIIRDVPAIVERSFLIEPYAWVWVMALVQALGIIASLYFMWNVRKPKA